MKILGRKRECDVLMQSVQSKRPEFVVLYGRRRIGKTYLIREFFNRQFSFYATGVTEEKTRGQLKAFRESLMQYGCKEKTIPKDWFEAFGRLRTLLSSPDVYREPLNGKKVVFLDELPWMDTQRSDFKSALDYFWNSWGSAEEDLLLIVCGSATSWIIDHLLEGRRGFHNRVTRRIRLLPFTLHECRELFLYNGIEMPVDQMIECYMVFGGVPFYLNMLNPRLSVAQNINELVFKEYGELNGEYNALFHSLFKKPEKHMEIVAALSKRKGGMNRTELSEEKSIGGGAALTKNLKELEQCGFIRKYQNYMKKKNECYYQLTDSYTLFYLHFLKEKKKNSWTEYVNTPGYHAWRGNAFEIVAFNHIPQIKRALEISGVESSEYGWRSKEKKNGTQIDILIDRNDGIINLCEAKYSSDAYEIDVEEYKRIQNRLLVFQQETGTKNQCILR